MGRNRLVLPLLVTIVAFAGCADDVVQPEPLQGPDAVSDLSALAPESSPRYVLQFHRGAPSDFSVRVEELGGAVVLNHPIGIAIVSGLEEAAAEELGARTRARFVTEEPQFQLMEPAAVSQAAAVSEALMSPQDPTQAILFAEQWNLRQVKADAAWAAGRLGSSGVTVAILDTGIDYLLPDLQGRVDLSRSISFSPDDDFFTQIFFPGRHLSTDLHYHGTNVATQVASNAWAFAGVTSQATLMSVKVCSVLGGCPGVIEGILYAVDHGADVINMSLGGWFRKSAFPGQVAIFNALMNYAAQAGVTVVVAAGNDSNDLDTNKNIAIRDAQGQIVDRIHIPSFFATYCDARHVICVAATRTNDISAEYTNYGRSAIDVSAPGGGSGDWVYSLCPQTSLVFFCEDGYYPLGVAGTSQAAPHVAGLAALVVEDVGRSPAQVRTRIRNGADAVGGRGNSPYHGMGRINVARTLGID